MKILLTILLIFSMFPYSIAYLDTDIQPNFLVINLFTYFLLISYRFPKYFHLLIIPFLTSLILLTYSSDYSAGLRSASGYLSLAIGLPIYYYIIITYPKIFDSVLRLSILTWTLVGLVQNYIYSDFLTFLAKRTSTGETRGVVSLAPEPTFFALMSIFFLLIIISREKSLSLVNWRPYKIILLLSIVILSKSSMVILLLAIWSLIYFLVNIGKKKSIAFIAFISTLVILLKNIDFSFLENVRFYQLFKLAIDAPTELFNRDASGNDRFSAIVFSLKGFIDNWFLPHFYGDYSNYLAEQIKYSEYFWYITINDRIKSFYGSILFELGFIGLIIPIVFYITLKKAFYDDRRSLVLYFSFTIFLLLTAIQIIFPLVPMLFASYASIAYQKGRQNA